MAVMERQDIHRRKVFLKSDLRRRELKTGLRVGVEW
jgi:hypothetical protein